MRASSRCCMFISISVQHMMLALALHLQYTCWVEMFTLHEGRTNGDLTRISRLLHHAAAGQSFDKVWEVTPRAVEDRHVLHQ